MYDCNVILNIQLICNMKNKKRICIELFAGAGGLALGLEMAGFEEIGLVEIDKNFCDTLRLNRPKWNILEEDIVEISKRDLLQEFSLKKGQLDLLSGGYPCQSFSYAGKKLGFKDVRGTMFYYYAEFLRQLKPKMFLAENVKGLTTHNGGKTIQTMIDVFEELGYKVEWKVLNAWDYGVGQKRQRVVIIGIRKDIADKVKFEYPKPHKYRPVLRDVLKDVPKSMGAKYPESKKKIFDLVPPGGCWRDLPDKIARDYMKSCYFMSGGRTGIARRLSWDEPSLTLTCSPMMKQTDRCHPDESRPLTLREYARIQSFPDEWQFAGSVGSVYKQIGNAVPVNLARCIGEEIIRALEEGGV